MEVRYDLPPERAEDLAALYADTEHWGGRGVAGVREALAGTDEVVALVDGDELVAAARVVTDYTFYARVYDVVVAADRRGEGLGHRLVAALVGHPELDDVHSWEVACDPALADFYGEYGFKDVTDDLHLLVRS